MIARNPSLADQVKAHLKERIVEGDFDEGRIPPEQELATELGVSRTTIRDALSRLEHEGAIYRRQGAGTFVNEPGLQIKSRLEEIWSYDQVLEDHGYTPSVEVLRVEIDAADEQTASDLAIDAGDAVVVVEKLFLEDDEPVVLTLNRIPRMHLRGDFSRQDGEAPIYELLERHTDRVLAYYLSELVPVSLDEREAGVLGVDPGTAAISFEEIGFDQMNEPVVRASSVFRDDLLRLRMIRRKPGA